MRTLDLFCGAGGLSLGLHRAGFDVGLALDSWPVAVKVHAENLPGEAEIFDLSDEDGAVALVQERMGRVDVVVGGPPCQDASSAGLRIEGIRSGMTTAFARIAVRLDPRFVVMENVAAAKKTRSYAEARSVLKEAGYGLTEVVLDASLCGTPQARDRFFCIGGRNEVDGFLDVELARHLAAEQMTLRQYAEAQGRVLGFDHYYRHPRTYQRRGIFSVDEPAPTMRGVNRPVPPTYKQHEGDTEEHSKVRQLTYAERAFVQTFPDDWNWGKHTNKSNLEQLIGNAVPPKLGEFIGAALMRYARRNAFADFVITGDTAIA